MVFQFTVAEIRHSKYLLQLFISEMEMRLDEMGRYQIKKSGKKKKRLRISTALMHKARPVAKNCVCCLSLVVRLNGHSFYTHQCCCPASLRQLLLFTAKSVSTLLVSLSIMPLPMSVLPPHHASFIVLFASVPVPQCLRRVSPPFPHSLFFFLSTCFYLYFISRLYVLQNSVQSKSTWPRIRPKIAAAVHMRMTQKT